MDLKAILYHPLTGWIVAAVLLLFMLVRPPSPSVEEKIVVRTETKWRTAERIITKPGATVYIEVDGSARIEGGVEWTRSGEGQASSQTTTDTKTVASSRARMSIAAGVCLPRPAWEVMAGFPFLHGKFMSAGLYVGAEGGLTNWTPNRVSAGVLLMF